MLALDEGWPTKEHGKMLREAMLPVCNLFLFV